MSTESSQLELNIRRLCNPTDKNLWDYRNAGYCLVGSIMSGIVSIADIRRLLGYFGASRWSVITVVFRQPTTDV